MEKLVSMIKQRVYFFSTPVIIGDAGSILCMEDFRSERSRDQDRCDSSGIR